MKNVLELNDLVYSPLLKLELQYWNEIGKLLVKPSTILEELACSIGLEPSNIDVSRLVQASLSHHWTRDPFDRMIVAHASLEESKLLTKDRVILKHYSKAFWS